MSRKSLLVLTPGRGSICKEQRDMLLRLSRRFDRLGWGLATCDETTSGMLAHSRNVLLAALAGRTQATHGLWIDTDCYWDESVILEMMERPEEMIVWNYPIRIPYDLDFPPERLRKLAEIGKKLVRRWTGTAKITQTTYRSYSPDGKLIELSQCAFGSVLMRREVALFMAERTPGCTLDWDARPVIPAFEVMSSRVGEDYSFCRRYVKAGGRIWCDPRPYVTNGTVGGCFAEEIARCDRYLAKLPYLCSVAA